MRSIEGMPLYYIFIIVVFTITVYILGKAIKSPNIGKLVKNPNKISKLYKSDYNKALSGVCGGIGEYLNISPTIIRIVFILTSNNGGLLVYMILALIIPYRDLYN